ncbi:sugar kinase [bacterium Unc6]|nr:sugar kinase [bacterium Unc6]
MKLLVVGSVGLDTVKTPKGEVKEVLGGSASYFSVAASFFTPVNLVAVVGTDFPKEYVHLFLSRKINTDGLKTGNGKTFRWKGAYAYDLNEARTIWTHLNVFKDFNPTLPQDYRHSQYIFLANIDPELQRNILKQIHSPKVTACDTMNYWIENKKAQLLKLLKDVNLFILNDVEARKLTQEPNLMKAARAIKRLGPQIIVIKKGEHGAMMLIKSDFFSIPAYPLEELFDPTGAGDSFAGGMIGYLTKQDKMDEATLKHSVVYGTVLASFCVEDFSLNRLKQLNLSSIKKRYREFEFLTHF